MMFLQGVRDVGEMLQAGLDPGFPVGAESREGGHTTLPNFV